MRLNYSLTLTIWTVGDGLEYPDCHDTQVWFFDQINELHKAVRDIADEIDVNIPLLFWGMKRRSPKGTFYSFGWSHGVVTIVKLID